jgi:molybdopterin-guanine dinucleotide biosynthesis protein B
MRAVSIVGFKKSGKTTLAVALCRALSGQGVTVAAAKFSHHGFDKSDSDTSRLGKECSAVVGLSQEETCLIWPGKRYLPDIVPMLQAEVLVVEGGKNLNNLPRIILPGPDDTVEALRPELALACYGESGVQGMTCTQDVGSLAQLVLERGFYLPGLDCGACGREDCGQMARDIVAGQAGADDCVAMHSELKVTVNGSPLGLNPFVSSIVAGSIKGMLSQLKGYGPGTIEISLES